MSNPYRKQQETTSRQESVKAARQAIAAALETSEAARVRQWLEAENRRRFIGQIEREIEAMGLIIEEALYYRREALRHAAALEAFREGRLAKAPEAPPKAPISAATMVSASRQREKLVLERERALEDADLAVARMLAQVQAKPQPLEAAAPGTTETASPKAWMGRDAKEAPAPRVQGAASAAA